MHVCARTGVRANHNYSCVCKIVIIVTAIILTAVYGNWSATCVNALTATTLFAQTGMLIIDVCYIVTLQRGRVHMRVVCMALAVGAAVVMVLFVLVAAVTGGAWCSTQCVYGYRLHTGNTVHRRYTG
jgi:hypothetical protein